VLAHRLERIADHRKDDDDARDRDEGVPRFPRAGWRWDCGRDRSRRGSVEKRTHVLHRAISACAIQAIRWTRLNTRTARPLLGREEGALSPVGDLVQQPAIDELEQVAPCRHVGDVVGERVRLERDELVGVPHRLVEERALSMIQVGERSQRAHEDTLLLLLLGEVGAEVLQRLLRGAMDGACINFENYTLPIHWPRRRAGAAITGAAALTTRASRAPRDLALSALARPARDAR
jgi:hypothetical protein